MEKIRIKGFKNGLNIKYDESMSFDEVISVTAEKFGASKKFFGSAAVGLKIEGREFSVEEEDKIIETIMQNCDLEIVCIISDNPTENSIYDESLRIINEEMDRSDVLFYNKSVINGKMIKSKKDIVIIGDVNPGCTIVSNRNIYIYGGLYGEAYAGCASREADPNEEMIIAALEMAPEELKIGSVSYVPPRKSFWGHKIKLAPTAAYVKDGEIVIAPYSKELFDGFTKE